MRGPVALGCKLQQVEKGAVVGLATQVRSIRWLIMYLPYHVLCDGCKAGRDCHKLQVERGAVTFPAAQVWSTRWLTIMRLVVCFGSHYCRGKFSSLAKLERLGYCTISGPTIN